MVDGSITYAGIGLPRNATRYPYDRLHLTDYMDVWLRADPAVGIDHLIYADGEVELRIDGYLLTELP